MANEPITWVISLATTIIYKCENNKIENVEDASKILQLRRLPKFLLTSLPSGYSGVIKAIRHATTPILKKRRCTVYFPSFRQLVFPCLFLIVVNNLLTTRDKLVGVIRLVTTYKVIPTRWYSRDMTIFNLLQPCVINHGSYRSSVKFKNVLRTFKASYISKLKD